MRKSESLYKLRYQLNREFFLFTRPFRKESINSYNDLDEFYENSRELQTNAARFFARDRFLDAKISPIFSNDTMSVRANY